MSTREQLLEIYQLLYDFFGPQHWWPGETPFEIALGAILTQNTSWTNVEKAIANIKAANCLDACKLHNLDMDELETLIRPAGYFRVKAKRLRNFTTWLCDEYSGDMANLQGEMTEDRGQRTEDGRRMTEDRGQKAEPSSVLRPPVSTARLREELLSISGIGPETADSILLYALNRPIFVVDTYTARIMVRHGLISPEGLDYHQLQDLFMSNLEPDAAFFNEFHALLVMVGKDYCKPKPRCTPCPLDSLPHSIEG